MKPWANIIATFIHDLFVRLMCVIAARESLRAARRRTWWNRRRTASCGCVSAPTPGTNTELPPRFTSFYELFLFFFFCLFVCLLFKFYISHVISGCCPIRINTCSNHKRFQSDIVHLFLSHSFVKFIQFMSPGLFYIKWHIYIFSFWFPAQ